jgi:hypothetical protein
MSNQVMLIKARLGYIVSGKVRLGYVFKKMKRVEHMGKAQVNIFGKVRLV